MRALNREEAEAIAQSVWMLRIAGFMLFCIDAVATGVLAWILLHGGTGDDLLAAVGIPCLLGMLIMSIDMMSDMAISRRLGSTARERPEKTPIRTRSGAEEAGTCTGS